MNPEKNRKGDKSGPEDASKLSYEDRVLKRMLNTPPLKKRPPDKQEKKPG